MPQRALISDIQHFSLHDGPGIRTTVFFKGCPLSCRWCHNPESISASPQLLFHQRLCTLCGTCGPRCPNGVLPPEPESLTEDGPPIISKRSACDGRGLCVGACPYGALEIKGRSMDIQAIVEECLLDRRYYKETGGVTISGGEPTVQHEALLELMKALKEEGISIVLDTCGMTSKHVLLRTLEYTDLYHYDIKCIDEERHKKWTGSGNKAILTNFEMLMGNGASLVARVPVIPGFNSDPVEMEAIASFLAPWRDRLVVHLLPYHSLGAGKYTALGMEYSLGDVQAPSNEEITGLSAYFEQLEIPVITMNGE